MSKEFVGCERIALVDERRARRSESMCPKKATIFYRLNRHYAARCWKHPFHRESVWLTISEDEYITGKIHES